MRWTPHSPLSTDHNSLRWSREAEGWLRAGGEEVGGGEENLRKLEEVGGGEKNLSSSVVRLEVRTIQYFLKAYIRSVDPKIS